MQVGDFDAVDRVHWESAEQVEAFIEVQGIASMLAFDGARCVGQLYLKAYDPEFSEPLGWTGNRPWADFRIAEPLELKGRFLTLGCYHVGRGPDGGLDASLYGRGIGTALLEATIDCYRSRDSIDGLLSWGLVSGTTALLQWAGQLSHTTYARRGFREVERLRDPRLDEHLCDVDTAEATEDPAILRVMLLS